MNIRTILPFVLLCVSANAQTPDPSPKPTPWQPIGSALDQRPASKVKIVGTVIRRTEEGLLIFARDTATVGGKSAKGRIWLTGYNAPNGLVFTGHGTPSGTYTYCGNILDCFAWADGSAK